MSSRKIFILGTMISVTIVALFSFQNFRPSGANSYSQQKISEIRISIEEINALSDEIRVLQNKNIYNYGDGFEFSSDEKRSELGSFNKLKAVDQKMYGVLLEIDRILAINNNRELDLSRNVDRHYTAKYLFDMKDGSFSVSYLGDKGLKKQITSNSFLELTLQAIDFLDSLYPHKANRTLIPPIPMDDLEALLRKELNPAYPKYFDATDSRCFPGAVICGQNKMPIYRQSDEDFAIFLKKYTSKYNKDDPGWCGMFSSAMAFKAVELSVVPGATFYPYPDEFMKMKSDKAFSKDDFDKYKFIYTTGRLVETHFRHGGTWQGDIEDGARKIIEKSKSPFKYIKADFYDVKKEMSEGSPFDLDLGSKLPNIDTGTVKAMVNASRPVFIVATGQYKEKSVKVIKCKKNGKCEKKRYYIYSPKAVEPHIITFWGYDGRFVKVFDPWGKIYNVTVEEKKILSGKVSKMEFAGFSDPVVVDPEEELYSGDHYVDNSANLIHGWVGLSLSRSLNDLEEIGQKSLKLTLPTINNGNGEPLPIIATQENADLICKMNEASPSDAVFTSLRAEGYIRVVQNSEGHVRDFSYCSKFKLIKSKDKDSKSKFEDSKCVDQIDVPLDENLWSHWVNGGKGKARLLGSYGEDILDKVYCNPKE